MARHWRYLLYVVRHKWFVLVAGRRRGVGLWQLLAHDLSKFRPDEWLPYAEWFYGYDGGSWYPVLKRMKAEPHLYDGNYRLDVYDRFDAFMRAFLRHLHRNEHHWQHWILLPDSQDNPQQVFKMPEKYAREMLADWDGAGRAITGKWDTPSWYARSGPKERLHPDTRAWVESELDAASGGPA